MFWVGVWLIFSWVEKFSSLALTISIVIAASTHTYSIHNSAGCNKFTPVLWGLSSGIVGNIGDNYLVEVEEVGWRKVDVEKNLIFSSSSLKYSRNWQSSQSDDICFSMSDMQVITYAALRRLSVPPQKCFLCFALPPYLFNGTSNEYLMCIYRGVINPVYYQASSLTCCLRTGHLSNMYSDNSQSDIIQALWSFHLYVWRMCMRL